MNVIILFAVFSDFFICHTESLVILKGRKDVRKDRTEFLFFNCTVSSNPISPYAEFLVNNISIASASYNRNNNTCAFLHSERNCEDLCKCQSDGKTYIWTYPVPSSKTSIYFSCHIFEQHYSPEKAFVWYNGRDFVDKKDDRKIVPAWSRTTTTRNGLGNGRKEQQKQKQTTSMKTGESTVEKIFMNPLSTSNIMYDDVDSFSVETTTKAIISTLQRTSTISINIKRMKNIEITDNKPTKLITENDLPISSTTEGRSIHTTDNELSPQHWFYYGPLIGVGLFCIVLFACNIIVNYKCRNGGRESIQHKGGRPQQAHITTSHLIESISTHSKSEDNDYESIGEIVERVSNDDGNRSQSSNYLDVVDRASDTTPYQVFSSFPDEDKHGYCVIENKTYSNTYNENEPNKKSTKDLSTSSGSSNSVSSCPSESQNEYVDILSWNNRNHGSDFRDHDIEVFTVSSSSNESLPSVNS